MRFDGLMLHSVWLSTKLKVRSARRFHACAQSTTRPGGDPCGRSNRLNLKYLSNRGLCVRQSASSLASESRNQKACLCISVNFSLSPNEKRGNKPDYTRTASVVHLSLGANRDLCTPWSRNAPIGDILLDTLSNRTNCGGSPVMCTWCHRCQYLEGHENMRCNVTRLNDAIAPLEGRHHDLDAQVCSPLHVIGYSSAALYTGKASNPVLRKQTRCYPWIADRLHEWSLILDASIKV